ncbi:MAG: hypothetical protein QOD41_1904 [Cryptosporangiaceae bacterium]|nr:hypothetical protein [Cryptosporangiaceae bacterium]
MTAHLAYAEGSPCPTLVLDSRALPGGEDGLLDALTTARGELELHGSAHVLKNALIRPSAHPLFDLDYRFVQSLPGGPGRYDLRGSCGHSILSSVVAGAEYGMLPALSPGQRIRVNVLNNGDYVVCEVDAAEPGRVAFTIHLLCAPDTRVSGLLMTGEPVSTVRADGELVEVSLVSMGNPYAFVSAASLGVTTRDQLFSDDPVLYGRMTRIRSAACELLGWDPAGAFPKIAVLLADGDGAIAARAISVPSWHPTLAVTGATCLGAAIQIAGTIPATLAGFAEEMVRIQTPGGRVLVRARTTGDEADPRLGWVSIGDKKVSYQGSFPLPASLTHVQEDSACLPIPV